MERKGKQREAAEREENREEKTREHQNRKTNTRHYPQIKRQKDAGRNKKINKSILKIRSKIWNNKITHTAPGWRVCWRRHPLPR